MLLAVGAPSARLWIAAAQPLAARRIAIIFGL